MEIRERLESGIASALQHVRVIGLLLDKEQRAAEARTGQTAEKVRKGGRMTQEDVREAAYGDMKTRFYYSDINVASIQAYTLCELAKKLDVELRLGEEDIAAVKHFSDSYQRIFRKGHGGLMEPAIPELWEQSANRAKLIADSADLVLEERRLMRDYEEMVKYRALLEAQDRARAEQKASAAGQRRPDGAATDDYQNLDRTDDGEEADREGTEVSEG
jgi:hypothetical protein